MHKRTGWYFLALVVLLVDVGLLRGRMPGALVAETTWLVTAAEGRWREWLQCMLHGEGTHGRLRVHMEGRRRVDQFKRRHSV